MLIRKRANEGARGYALEGRARQSMRTDRVLDNARCMIYGGVADAAVVEGGRGEGGARQDLLQVVLGGTGMEWASACSCKQLPVGGERVVERRRGGEWMDGSEGGL